MKKWRDSASIFPSGHSFADTSWSDDLSPEKARRFCEADIVLTALFIVHKDFGLSTIRQCFRWWMENRPEASETRLLERWGLAGAQRIHWNYALFGGYAGIRNAILEDRL